MRKLALLLMGVVFCAVSAYAQRTISGKVTDDKGAPVPNASVEVKGTTVGTITKDDGSWALVIPANATTLIISSINTGTNELSITSAATYNTVLSKKDKSMDEVVVVAYGTVKKELVTGSVGQIKTDQIAKRPIGNITGAIEGNVPGVITTAANGQPGSGLAIRVRGFGSFSATSEPLIILDGIPYTGGTSNINPDDVESISILKDAASTALYGSRAGNGVVVITTKRGKKGRNAISIRAMEGFVTRGLPEYDRVDAFQYYPVMWEAYRNSLVYPISGAAISLDSANRVASGLTNRTSIQGLLAYNPFNVANNAIVGTNGLINPAAQLKYPDDLDWTKDLMRNGTRRDYTINFNGGADKVDYLVSLGYLREDGYTIKTDLERYSARMNVNVQPKTWLKTGLNIGANYSESTTAADGGSTNFVNPFFFSRNVGPIYPVYAHNMTTGQYVLDANGNKIWDLGNYGTSAIGIANGIPNRPSGGFAGRHGLAETILNIPVFKRSFVSARNYVDIMFLKNFKFTNNIALDIQNQNNSSYENTLVGDGAPGGRSQKQSLTVTTLNLNQLLNYTKKLKGGHTIDALVGHESWNRFDTDLNGFKQGQTLTGNTELGNFTTINSLGSSVDRLRLEGYFTRVNYDFMNKYFISGSLRRDGNSTFSPDSRWGTFWSVGGGWNMHRESFMANVKWIDMLKFRGSYGAVGVADGIGFYAYQGLYGFANNANEPGIVQSTTSVYNPDLKWEKNIQFDLGVDFGFFKNRITGLFEIYTRTSSDLLFAVPLPLSSGLLSFTKNTATIRNKGIEAQVSADIIKMKDFTWNTTVNVSTVRNEITEMPSSVPEFISGTKKYKVGQSLFDYWLRTYYGVDPTDGSALYVSANKTIAAGRRIITKNNGGPDTVTTNINNALFEYQGATVPDFYGSFSTSFSYKQLTLSALFSFQKGGKTYDALYQSLMSVSNYGGALHPDILKRWQKPGDVTDVPRMDAGRAADFNAQSSRWLTDASFLNIRNITLSYEIPASLVSRFKITNAQVFLTADNVAFMSKRKGMNNQQAFSGVVSNAYPPARIVTAGLSLNF